MGTPKMMVYKCKCIDCDVIFYVENQGQLDDCEPACPICESDERVEKWEGKTFIVETFKIEVGE